MLTASHSKPTELKNQFTTFIFFFRTNHLALYPRLFLILFCCMKPNWFLFLPYTKISYEIRAYTNKYIHTYIQTQILSTTLTFSQSLHLLGQSLHQSTHQFTPPPKYTHQIDPPIIQTDKYIQVSFYMILYNFIIFILFCNKCYLLFCFYYFKKVIAVRR